MSLASALLLTVGTILASGPPAGTGGTGGSGGGTGGGGGTPAAPCTPIQTAQVKPGYRPGGNGAIGAVWTTYTLKPCTPGVTYVATIKVTNLDINLGWYEFYTQTLVMSGTIDDDNARLGTNYRVDVVVTDYSTGSVLDSRSFLTATPLPATPAAGS